MKVSASSTAAKSHPHNRIPRILIDNGSYGLQNMGDVAMLQAAVARLRCLWPEAEILVVTDRTVRLARAIAGVVPVPTYGHLLGSLHPLLPNAERWIFRHAPWIGLLIMKATTKLMPAVGRQRNMDDFAQIVGETDLVVASGGGYMTDPFDFYALPILETLALAVRQGKTTAMLGQGVGPFAPAGRLQERAAEVLPHLDRILVREPRVGPQRLREMGVAADRVTFTGDDAVVLARATQPERPGEALGVNIRLMRYSQIDRDHISLLRKTLAEASAELKAPLVPLPVSVSPNEADHVAIQEMLTGIASFEDAPPPSLPVELMARIARCRVVVTGAYHCAVFALSCGIPAVCLVRSAYYEDKMAGLAHCFGEGCHIVRLDPEDAQQHLRTAIHSAWQDAERTRAGLLAAADRQICLGDDAYAELVALARQRIG